jgi:tetratricopeptide (TPR) repeat protein
MFPLVSGDYQLRVILKNQARNEYTVLESEISVPEIPDTPYLGDPLLLYNTEEIADPEAAGTYRTYQIGSARLDPNPKLAYVIGGRLLTHIPLVHAEGGYQLSYRIVGSDDPTQEIDSKTVEIERYGDAPIVEEFALVNIAGGRYRLVVDLLDPAGKPVGTHSADFTVTPRTEILRPWIMRESINGEEIGLVLAALAEQYLKQGRNAEARDACEKALEHNPNLAAPRVFLGRFHLDEKQPVETIKLLEPAYAQNKENVQIILTLGDAHFEVKNFERAAQLYESALTLQRPGKELLNALAVSYTQLGNSEKAIQYFERSLELDPEQPSVKELMEKLKSGI